MIGTWIARIGFRLLHRETFTMMLAPAIADLQFETAARGAARPCDYCGIVRALIGAFWFDISADARTLADDLPTIGVMTAIQASYYGFMLVLLSGLGTGKISALDLDTVATRAFYYLLAVSIASVVTSSACFWPARRTYDASAES
jgi:hypothetical protein